MIEITLWIPPGSCLMNKIPALHYSMTDTVVTGVLTERKYALYMMLRLSTRCCGCPQTPPLFSLYHKSIHCSQNSASNFPYSSSNPVGLGLGPLGTVQSQQKLFHYAPLTIPCVCPPPPALSFLSHSSPNCVPKMLFSSAPVMRTSQRTWVCKGNLGDLLLAHISPKWWNRNKHYRTRTADDDGVKVCRLMDRSPFEVAYRLFEEQRGGRNGHDGGIAVSL